MALEGNLLYPQPRRSYAAKSISVAKDIGQKRDNASLNRVTVESPTLTSADVGDKDDGIRATILSKKRRVETINELKQCVMVSEQDKLQVRENASWKGKF